MSTVRISLITAALQRKGFVEERRDHFYYLFHVGGKKTSVFTYISHGEREADDWLLGKIARQLHVSRKELLALIECSLSEADFLELMIERGYVRR